MIVATEDGYKQQAKRVTEAQDGEYARITREYQRYSADHPGDLTARLEACRFAHYFADAEDVVVEASSKDAETCDDFLGEPAYERDGPIQLFLLERMYGAKRLARANKLLPEAYGWTPPQRARLYEAIADGYLKSNPAFAARNLESALQLDPLSARRVQLAKWLAGSGARQRALQLMRSTPEQAWDNLSLDDAGRLLLELDAPAEAVNAFRRAEESDSSAATQLLLARALELDGKYLEARAAYQQGLQGRLLEYQRQGAADYVEFELKHGTRAQAVAAHDRARDLVNGADPWGRLRLALFLRDPTARWTLQDAINVVRFAGLIAGCLLLPGLVVIPVHYRSLAKRLNGWCPSPGVWGLRTMWAVLGVMTVVPTLLLYVLSYECFTSLVPHLKLREGHSIAETVMLGNLLIAQTIIFLCVAAWLLRSIDLRSVLIGHSPVGPRLRRLLAALLILVLLWAMVSALMRAFPSATPDRQVAFQALQSVNTTHGPWLVVLLAAILVPIAEETFFRGVILSALARYMSFGWAAVLQAALFAGLHESVVVFPFLFGLGLLSAWLVREKGGLLGPMLLHGTNNLLATSSLLTASHLSGVGW